MYQPVRIYITEYKSTYLYEYKYSNDLQSWGSFYSISQYE